MEGGKEERIKERKTQEREKGNARKEERQGG